MISNLHLIQIESDQLSSTDRYFGLHNFGNTCYCNSVLQALFFCPPFRDRVLQYRVARNNKNGSVGKKDSLLNCLCDLFHNIASQKKKCGVLYPKKFITRLRKEYESFDNYAQHDAHELFNRLLNSIHIVLMEENKAERERVKLLGQQMANGMTIKRERSSFFSRKRKSKKSINNSSLPLTPSSPATVDGTTTPDAEVASTGSEMLAGVTAGDTSSSNPPPLSGKPPPHGGATADSGDNNSTTTKSGFSIFGTGRRNKTASKQPSVSCSEQSDCSNETSADNTWINEIFQGTYTTMTRCLTCETVKNHDEDFLDLSIDIEQNTSISHCLRVFSNQQMLNGEHKYSCDVCRSKQEAQIEMRIKKLPKILALHLKRFKYCDTLNKYTKLSYRVVFPFELRLFNTTDDATNPERLYDLIAVVVHCGSGPHRGHYVSIVKSQGMWLLFDDDNVDKIEPSSMEDFYGISADKNSESGYILFYQSRYD